MIATEPTLYVILKLAPVPMAPTPTGAALVLIVVATAEEPGSTMYVPVEITLKVTIAPGVVKVVNTSIKHAAPPEDTVPPESCSMSPGK